MKNLCFLILMAIVQNGPGIYDKEIRLISGSTLSFSQFKGSTIVIFEFDFSEKCLLELKYLDSLTKKSPNIKVVAFPVNDFAITLNEKETKIKAAALNVSFPVSEPVYASRSKGQLQHSLFKWLTSKEGNRHFDEDVLQAGTLYVINSSGELRSVINLGTTDTIKNAVILNNQSH